MKISVTYRLWQSVALIWAGQLCSSYPAEPIDPPAEIRLVYPYQMEEGGHYLLGGTVKMIAEVSDPQEPITKIEFFADGMLLGGVTNSPYIFRWIAWPDRFNIAIALTAKLYTEQGLYRESLPVRIFVTQDVSPPVVEIAGIESEAVFSARKDLHVLVKLIQTDDASGEVELLLGANLIGRSSDPPYEFVIGPYPAGEYILQARGRTQVSDQWSLSPVIRVRVLNLSLRQPTLSNEVFRFEIDGLPAGQSYGVEASNDLVDWTLIWTNLASGHLEQFSHSLTNKAGNRFYRAVAPVP